MATVSARLCQSISQTAGLGCMKDSTLNVGLIEDKINYYEYNALYEQY
jgi:hypothetical protein